MRTLPQPSELTETLLDTPRDLARVCNTTPQTINTWHRKGLIPAKICIGRVIRFDRAEALAALAAASQKEVAR